MMVLRSSAATRRKLLFCSNKFLRCYTTAAAAAAVAISSTTTTTGNYISTAQAFTPMLRYANHHRSVTPPLFSSSSSSSLRYATSLAAATRTVEEIEMTKDALAMVHEAIHAVNPTTAIQRHLTVNEESGILTICGQQHSGDEHYDAKDYEKVILVAFGKASSAMAAACVGQLKQEASWRDIPLEGVVIVKDDHATAEEYDILTTNGNILVQEASHPVPDERSVAGAKAIRELIQGACGERALILCCISGGGSSLFCEPLAPLTLDDLQCTNEALLASGLGITDMNVIRKRCDTNKGGKLLKYSSAANESNSLVTLVLSDIIGDPLDLIASGPTVPDTSKPGDAWRLVQSNPVLKSMLPPAVLKVLEDDKDDDATPMTTKEHTTVLVGNNALAVQAAAEEAERRGYHTIVLGTRMEGETRHVAGVYTSMAQHIVAESSSKYVIAKRPAALIAGGETTVTLPATATGKGGRNQEMAVAAALQLDQLGLRNVVLASAGTDGTDGPNDAAGAVVDGGTIHRLPNGSAQEALQEHDAYPYLDQVEEDGHSPLIKTGPTGTNVADVCVTLIR